MNGNPLTRVRKGCGLAFFYQGDGRPYAIQQYINGDLQGFYMVFDEDGNPKNFIRNINTGDDEVLDLTWKLRPWEYSENKDY